MNSHKSTGAFDGSISKTFDESAIERIAFVQNIEPGSHIHISGVCGTGTGSVLALLKMLNFHVTGSDKAFYPPMGDVVKNLADKIFLEFSASNLEPRPALVVIGNALSRGNVEVEYILEKGIPYCSMPELFSALLIGTHEDCGISVVVSGTHGKTTTSSLIATVLSDAGRNPGYFIGGIPTNAVLDGSLKLPPKEMEPSKRIVVLEGDEYDSAFFAKYSKFQCYRPDICVVTNIEFDHGDIFEDIAAIEKEFKAMLLKIPASGTIVACRDNSIVVSMIESLKAEQDGVTPADATNKKARNFPKIHWYGENPAATLRVVSRKPWMYQQLPDKRFGQEIEYVLGEQTVNIRTKLTGLHNALNIAACFLVAKELGVGTEIARRSLEKYTPVMRRQQIIAEKNGVILVEDFAHHPTEVKVTLEGLHSAYPDKRLVAVFEPRSNTSRRDFFKAEYQNALSVADIIILKEIVDSNNTYTGVAAGKGLFNVSDLKDELNNAGKIAYSAPEIEMIIQTLKDVIKPNDLIVIMSNGDFGGLPQLLRTLILSK